MKYQELDFQMIGLAVLHRWKTIAVTFAVFLIMGVIAGFLFGDRASAEGSGGAPQWQSVDFESVTLDLNYYSNCYTSLSQKSGTLYTYVNSVCLDTTMTEDQYQCLLSLCKEITEYQEKVLTEISKDLSALDAFYIPSSLRQDAVQEYTWLRDSTRDQMVKAENAMVLLQSIGGLTSTNEDINATYASLLSQAAEYGQLQLNLEKYEKILDRLENDYTRVQADSWKMKSKLEQAAAELNELGGECYQTVQEIALENHLNITASEKSKELAVSIDHTNRPATRQEAFLAFVLFLGLVGVIVGGYVALWQECKHQRRD